MKKSLESKKQFSSDVITRMPVSWLSELTVNAETHVKMEFSILLDSKR